MLSAWRTTSLSTSSLSACNLAGGYFGTAGNDPSILLRVKEDYDGAEPAASSVAACNLARLSGLLEHGSGPFAQRAQQVVASVHDRCEASQCRQCRCGIACSAGGHGVMTDASARVAACDLRACGPHA